MKNKSVATVLNFIPLGLGYIYLGMRRRFVKVVLIGIACPFIGVVLAVILDGIIPSILNVSGLTECDFNHWYLKCPRPSWVLIVMIVGLMLPSAILSIITIKHIRKLDGYFV